MSKFTLGEVIDGLLSGNFTKATAQPVDDWVTELAINEKGQNRIYKRETLGDHELYNPFVPGYDDQMLKWNVEYSINHQPMDVIAIVFNSDRDGCRNVEKATFENKSWIEVNTKMIDAYYFKGYRSAVGHYDGNVVVFRGKVEEA